MKTKKTVTTNIKGIERNANDINIGDGSCDEIINMRFRDGAWRPVGNKDIRLDLSDVTGIESITHLYRHEALPENFFVGKLNDSIILLNNIPYISPAIEDVDAIQASSQFNLSVYIDGDYTIGKDVGWISLDKAVGNGIETVVVTVNASDTADRTGIITASNGTTILTCTVNQEGITIESSTPINTSAAAKTINHPITILPIDAEFTSSVISDVDNIISSLTDDQDDNEVDIVLVENVGAAKTATIRITHDDFGSVIQDIVINQSAVGLVLTVDPIELNFTSAALESDTIDVTITPDATIGATLGDGTNFEITDINQTTNVITVRTKAENSSGNPYNDEMEVTSPGYPTGYVTLYQATS